MSFSGYEMDQRGENWRKVYILLATFMNHISSLLEILEDKCWSCYLCFFPFLLPWCPNSFVQKIFRMRIASSAYLLKYVVEEVLEAIVFLIMLPIFLQKEFTLALPFMDGVHQLPFLL